MFQFKRTRKLVKNHIKVREWSDYDRTVDNAKGIFYFLRYIFRVRRGVYQEDFERAKERLGLTENQLQQRMRSLWRLSMLSLSFAAALFIYAIYSLIYVTLPPAMLCFSLTGVCLCLAFRYHFLYFQIKSRKLGCSLKEWLQGTIVGRFL